ncbi:large ribosomal subunit protein bL21m [Humulus lupulus]|uniref:large ribosomal subunit protein bL21m n=1 Tax=Humulus lupulus TaxID=3486 RepID=UPI002B413053|nr:large ribosomal subunit protein bL21m [Humulus lupulus]
MANRRCLHTLARHSTVLFSKIHSSLHSLTPPIPLPTQQSLQTIATKFALLSTNQGSARRDQWSQSCHFSSKTGDGGDEDTEDEEDDDDEEDYESTDDEGVSGPSTGVKREYTPEEKEAEAAAIGYKVVGPLERSDRVFKLYEPVFAVVQIGSHQFKVSNGDCIFTERLKFCDINEKIILNKVLMLGSSSQTVIGRPIVPDANVHAIVEEHALDAKVLIFKKKRRKNYRRTKGHRQELTKLRIVNIQGIEKPEIIEEPKTPGKKQEKVTVAA